MPEVLEALEEMRRVQLCKLMAVESVLCMLEGVRGAGGDAACATLYAGGCGECGLFAGGAEVADGAGGAEGDGGAEGAGGADGAESVGVAGGGALCATSYAGGCRG